MLLAVGAVISDFACVYTVCVTFYLVYVPSYMIDVAVLISRVSASPGAACYTCSLFVR